MSINIAKLIKQVVWIYVVLVCLGVVDAPHFGQQAPEPSAEAIGAVVDDAFNTETDGGWTQLKRSRSF